MIRRWVVFLDANVLFSARLRDAFCRLDEAGVIRVAWSPEVMAETRRALVQAHGLSSSQTDRLFDRLQLSFPGASVTGFEHRVGTMTNNPGDRHVLAAAVHAEADLLITFNLNHFLPDAVDGHDLLVVDPDTAGCMLTDLFPTVVSKVITEQAAALRSPPMTVPELLDGLEKVAPLWTTYLRGLLVDPEYLNTLRNVALAGNPTSPQVTVDRFVDAIRSGDDMVGAWAELHPEHRERLIVATLPRLRPQDRQALAQQGGSHGRWSRFAARCLPALKAQFADMNDGPWGYANAPRVVTPTEEIVKVIRIPPGGPLIKEPTLVAAHLFRLVWSDAGWTIAGIDEPDPALQSGPRRGQ